jgi:hypothetical protein
MQVSIYNCENQRQEDAINTRHAPEQRKKCFFKEKNSFSFYKTEIFVPNHAQTAIYGGCCPRRPDMSVGSAIAGSNINVWSLSNARTFIMARFVKIEPLGPKQIVFLS